MHGPPTADEMAGMLQYAIFEKECFSKAIEENPQMNYNVPLVSFNKKVQKVSLILLVVAAMISVGIITAQQVFAANVVLACTGFPVNVNTAADLEEAIGCFNNEVAAGTYTINVVGNIALTSSLSGIDNTTAGTVFELNGGNFTVDGQDTVGLRPFSVFTDTTVIFKDVTITGGNIDSITGTLRNQTSGAALINYGNLTLNNVTVTENSSEDWGGGIFSEETSTLTLIDSEISNNTAGEDGGGIQNFGDMTITNSLIKGNSAVRFSGGIGIDAPLKTVSISNTSIVSNTSRDGGGIYNRNAATIVSGSIITGNIANDRGGGIFNNRPVAVMTVTNTIIDNNFARISGGGVHNNLEATLTVLNSSIANNSVNTNENSIEGGGGLRNDRGKVAMQNTTVSGNTSRTGVTNRGWMTLTHVTIANNSIANVIGVGLQNYEPLTVTEPSQLWIYNSAISDNPVDCLIETGSSIEGNVGNLIETDSAGLEACSTTDTINADAQFLPLENYGGDTDTHNIQGTSPLIDAADATICASLIDGSFDQRGVARPQGSGCDIGAYESTTEISVDDVSITEGNDGTQNMVFTVTRNSNQDAFTVVANTQDGTATAGSDYVAVTNQTVSFTSGGALSQQVTVVVNGDIAFEGDETFKLLLSNATEGAIVDSEGIGTIQENQTIGVSVTADASVAEGDSGSTQYTFTFTLNGVTGGNVTVNYMTSDGSATVASGDYESATGSVTLDGTTNGDSATASVTVYGDTTSEIDETFNLNVTSISNPSVGADPVSFEATIANDDAPTVSFSSAAYTVSSGGDATITLELSAPATGASSVLVTSSNGTATAGSDFTGVSETVTFSSGESSKTFTVSIGANTSDEEDETFTLSLSNYNNLGAGATTSTEVTISSGVSIYLPLITR